MPGGLRCDAKGCQNFVEAPQDSVGGYQLVANWLEVRLATGRFYACSPEHAAAIAKARHALQLQGVQDSEAHAVALQRQASGGAGYDPVAQAELNERAASGQQQG